MSVIGSPIDTSLLQAAEAQRVASRVRDHEKAARDGAARRFQDMVDLRVTGVEGPEAPRRVPPNDSQQHDAERRPFDHMRREDVEADSDDPPRIDVQA